MSSIAANTQDKVKQVMRTALVGVTPADQVMLKGYLRVLLRLEADLEWAPANHSNIDLFIINNEFRSAPSVIKLLNSREAQTVLYVTRNQHGEGGMNGDLITLPLKKLHDLNGWLIKNVGVLQSGAKRRQFVPEEELEVSTQRVNTTAEQQLKTSTNNKQPAANQATIQPQSVVQNQPVVQKKPAIPKRDYQPLVDFVKMVNKRPEGLFVLKVKGQQIGLVNLKRQRLWLYRQNDVAPDLTWELTHSNDVEPDAKKAQDLFQWLWEQTWIAPQDILAMVSDEQKYQLHYWSKPQDTKERREILRLMTALESESLSVEELSNKAGTSELLAKKIIAALLMSGGLQNDSYVNLKAPTRATVVNIESGMPVIEGQDVLTTQQPKVSKMDEILARRASGQTANTNLPSTYDLSKQSTTSKHEKPVEPKEAPAKQEKRGFLSKLRDKLGL